MPKGKAKSKFNYETNTYKYSNNSWCKLPKYKRCEHCIRCENGDKACEVEL